MARMLSSQASWLLSVLNGMLVFMLWIHVVGASLVSSVHIPGMWKSWGKHCECWCNSSSVVRRHHMVLNSVIFCCPVSIVGKLFSKYCWLCEANWLCLMLQQQLMECRLLLLVVVVPSGHQFLQYLIQFQL